MQIQHLFIPEQACQVKGRRLPPSSEARQGARLPHSAPWAECVAERTPTGQAEAARGVSRGER